MNLLDLANKEVDSLEERVGRFAKTEEVFRSPVEFLDPRDVAGRTLRRPRQAFDDQRAEIVFQHHVFEITMELRNCGGGTGHRH